MGELCPNDRKIDRFGSKCPSVIGSDGRGCQCRPFSIAGRRPTRQSGLNRPVIRWMSDEPLGQHPFGRIVYTADGQMIGILAHERRPKPKGPIATDGEALELYRTFVSYTGRYELAGDTVTHHVDISWNEVWTGTDLVRRLKLDGERLTLSTLSGTGSTDSRQGVSVLVWERET